MKTRKLGWTELELSAVGLGTWAMGGSSQSPRHRREYWQYGWGQPRDRDSIAAIGRLPQLGVNWLDTAPIYGLGHAEALVGEALKGRSPRPLLATKCGIVWDREGNISFRLKSESIRSEVEASLKRLRVETIDLYQLHWPNPQEQLEEAWGVMAELMSEGKIRYAGVSNFSVAQLERVQAIHPVASLQPPYGMLSREVEEELLGYCSANNIGVITYDVLAKGLLSGRFDRARAERLPEDDHRRREDRFREPQLSANLELVERLRPLAQRRGKTVAQLATAWVLRRPEVTSAILGARSPAQLEETAGAAAWTLSAGELGEVEALLAARDRVLS